MFFFVFLEEAAQNDGTNNSPKLNEREPIINNSSNTTNAGPISPSMSHNSASSDPWPSQSDEDIDRLVALHRNGNSLTSLGVRLIIYLLKITSNF